MKKNTILLVCALALASSCKLEYKYPKFDYSNGPNPCVNAFKDRVFFSILRKSYRGTTAFEEINKRDAFNPYDGLPVEILPKIDSIAQSFLKKMPPPSLCDYCTKDMNYFMAQALHFYRSNDLDSTTRKVLGKYGPSNLCNLKD